MRDIRVRLQAAPCGLLRVVSPDDEVAYLPIREGAHLHPFWKEGNLSLFLAVKAGSEGELVIDFQIVVQPPEEAKPVAEAA